MRRPLTHFEQAARQLATDRERDPDELTFFGHPQGEKRPIWVNFAEALRSHWEKNKLLENMK